MPREHSALSEGEACLCRSEGGRRAAPSEHSCILSHPSIRLLLNGLKKDQPQGKDKRLLVTINLVHQLVGRLSLGCLN